jgi:hypothetical protein
MVKTSLLDSVQISADRPRAHVKFLASDLIKGRMVGARGGDLATEYIAPQFELLDTKSFSEDGTYFQNVPLVAVEPQPSTEPLALPGGAMRFCFGYPGESVGLALQQNRGVLFDTVFVGYGITAPDINGTATNTWMFGARIVVLFTLPLDDLKFFARRVLANYGRWAYELEEVARRGAAGAIIIHSVPTASYGWDLVPSSSAREGQQMELAPGAHNLAFSGHVTTEYNEHRYHRPADEYFQGSDFSRVEKYCRFGMLIGLNVPDDERISTCRTGDEFLPAWGRSPSPLSPDEIANTIHSR